MNRAAERGSPWRMSGLVRVAWPATSRPHSRPIGRLYTPRPGHAGSSSRRACLEGGADGGRDIGVAESPMIARTAIALMITTSAALAGPAAAPAGTATPCGSTAPGITSAIAASSRPTAPRCAPASSRTRPSSRRAARPPSPATTRPRSAPTCAETNGRHAFAAASACAQPSLVSATKSASRPAAIAARMPAISA